jgi:cytochrome b
MAGTTEKTVRAWDVPTRVFHWTLLALIIAAPLTANSADPLKTAHKINGYAILILIVWRLLWGFAGGSTSRWAAFFPWPWKVFGYAVKLLRGPREKYLGHNPLGAAMVFALIAAVIAQAGSGLFTTDDIVTAGPLYPVGSTAWNKLAGSWHQTGFLVILGLAAFHVVANLLYSAFSGVNLIGAMFSGRKPELDYIDEREAHGGPVLLALALLALSAGLVLGGIWIVGGDFAAGPALDFG